MVTEKNVPLSLTGQLLYASGSAAFTMLERLILLYMPFYYLPPEELGLTDIIYNRTYLALLPELGHNNAMRINLSTMIAFFGLAGMVMGLRSLPPGNRTYLKKNHN